MPLPTRVQRWGEITYIIDGNAVFHSLNKVPETFGEVAKTVFASLPQVSKVHFLTDNYKNDSIKSIRRGNSCILNCWSAHENTKGLERIFEE